MSMVTVETRTRWETTSLLRKLRGHGAYAIQLDHAHWLVRTGDGDTKAFRGDIERLVAEWGTEEGLLPRVAWAADGGADAMAAPS
jgi:hypothetical protein